MYKVFEVRATEEKTFAKLIREFNSILAYGGKEVIKPVRVGTKDIECRISSASDSFTYTVPGTVYAVNVPDEVLSFNGHTPIGTFTRVGKVWIKHTLTDNTTDIADVSESNFRCDHCGKNIKNRNGYWFFRRGEDGALVVVGSTCVKKFFGLDPEKLLAKLGALLEYEKDTVRVGGCGKHEIPTFDLKTCYAVTKKLTNGFKFWEKKDNGKIGTAAKVKNALYQLVGNDVSSLLDLFKTVSGLTDDDMELIELAKSYWQNVSGDSDFTVNTRNIMAAGRLAVTLAGYASFGLFKAINDHNNRKAPAPKGDFVGTIGERITAELIAKDSHRCVREIQTGWHSYKHQEASKLRFEDANGNVFTSLSSGKVIAAAEQHLNQPFTYRFTVVKHFTERNGQKVNIINRVMV